MQSRMTRYHTQKKVSWGYLGLSVAPAVLVVSLMFGLNAETLLKLTLAIFLILSIIGLIFIGIAIVDRITGKSDRKVEMAAIGVVLSILLLVFSYRTICSTNYSEKGDLIVNVFQKRRLDQTAKKFQHIKKTLKSDDNLAQRKIALKELNEISTVTLENTKSLKGRSGLKDSINDIRAALKGDNSTFVEINLMVVAATYGYSVLTEHYTNQQFKQDKARTVDTFVNDAGVKL